MPIVKCTNRQGRTYAYLSESHYDPEKGSRPKKTYLGRVDPVTGEIIPPTGKRGRPRKRPPDDGQEKPDATEYISLRNELLEVSKRVQACEETIQEQKQRINQLTDENRKLRGKLSAIHRSSDLAGL